MRNVVLVRYGEIAVKSWRIRKQLEKLLVRNILQGLKLENLEDIVDLRLEEGRILIYVNDMSKIENILKILSRIFGIKSISPAIEIEFRNLDDIVKICENYWKDTVRDRTFAIRCRRVGKHEFTSKDVEKVVGEALRKYAKRVDLENPEIEIFIEIRNNRAYIYDKIIEGPGGLPLGSEGKALALVSGGFDSPVAAWLVMKRGVIVDFLTVSLAGELDLLPALKVILKLCKDWCIGYRPKIYIVHAEDLVNEIRKKVKIELWNVVYKRCLYYIADYICRNYRSYRAIVTGDVIGQVSTQTLDNLYSTSIGITTPIIRPLAGFDKDDIIQLSKKIGTYELSIEVSEYCAIFSEKPKTWTTPEEVDLEFYKVKRCLDNIVRNNIEEVNIEVVETIIRSIESKVKDIDIETIDSVDHRAILLDVRPRKDFKLKISNSNIQVVETNIDEVFKVVEKYGKEPTYLIYCKSPLVSRYVALKLREQGYNAYSVLRI